MQESLGGNSRTTLIINCSPSSYNEAETLSTLRFGMRAKTIKNKAKVNADLSPAELKALLKKVKSQAVTFQTYIAALEGEVSIWRKGGSVSEDKWVTMDKIAKGDLSSLPPAPGFKSPIQEEISRPSTPAIILEKDEREEFMSRENELMDQIAEKETELAQREKLLETLKEEMSYYKDQEQTVTKENQQMTSELSDLRLQLQKVSYESKENAITVDSLREANQDLLTELDELKKSLAETRLAHKEATDGEKEKRKAEKMAQMMSGFDRSGQINEKERQIRDALTKLDGDASSALSAGQVSTLQRELADSKLLVSQHDKTIQDLSAEKEAMERKRAELEKRLGALEHEYEELLDKTIAEEEQAAQDKADIADTLTDLKQKLELQHANKKEMQQREIEELKHELIQKNTEHQKLVDALADLKAANTQLQTKLSEQPAAEDDDWSEKERDLERTRKTMAQQLADFEVMKKALMRDLQNRCEKVVELEMSLDETREQYNTVLRTSNNKAQQKKMAFLERNLEQLTNVQKQLVEQNTSLKKEVALAERKLIARNERIQNLESLLTDAQDKLLKQNDKFEAQLNAVRERLEQARSQQKAQSSMGISFGRIAKPLRGGGASAVSAGEDVNNSGGSDKRQSWIANLMTR